MNNQCQRIPEESSANVNSECITEVGDLSANPPLDDEDPSQFVIVSGSIESCKTDEWSVFSLNSAGFKEETSDFNSCILLPSASRGSESTQIESFIRRHASADNIEIVRNLDAVRALSRRHNSYGLY